jgi:acyl-CoA synthetase (AMP-forming)/AMP-acid ligase II
MHAASAYMTMTLVDILERHARDAGTRRAFVFLENGEHEAVTLTYAELAASARRIAARLQAWGASGERVLLLFPPGLDFIEALCGCLYAKAVPVPALPVRRGQALARLEGIARDAQPHIALTSEGLLAKTREFLAVAAPGLPVQSIEQARAHGRDGDWCPLCLESDDPALLQYTSGSTGAPRGVLVTHGNLLHNQRFIAERLEQSRETVGVSWLPMFHDMGLIGKVIQPLYLGCQCILMSPEAFLQKPRRWLAAITRYRATATAAPNFAYDLCVDRIPPEERTGLDLSSLRVAYNGSEPVQTQTLAKFSAAFGPFGFDGSAFYPCYGLAEATLMVAGGKPGRGPVLLDADAAELERNVIRPAAPGDARRALVGCGTAAPDHCVRIVDPATGTPLPEGRIGEVWVAGPSVAAGYWRRPEDTQEYFGARLAAPGGGAFLRTGDLGGIAGGELFVTGRLKDIIIVRGRNHYPADIEHTAAQSHPALQPGCAAAFTVQSEGRERLVIVSETRREHWRQVDPSSVTEIVRERVAREHGLRMERLLLVKPGCVPKTSSGKVRRQSCRALYLAGALESREERADAVAAASAMR